MRSRNSLRKGAQRSCRKAASLAAPTFGRECASTQTRSRSCPGALVRVTQAHELRQDSAGACAAIFNSHRMETACTIDALEDAFAATVDYAMLQKVYDIDPEGERRYGLSCVTSSRR